MQLSALNTVTHMSRAKVIATSVHMLLQLECSHPADTGLASYFSGSQNLFMHM